MSMKSENSLAVVIYGEAASPEKRHQFENEIREAINGFGQVLNVAQERYRVDSFPSKIFNGKFLFLF